MSAQINPDIYFSHQQDRDLNDASLEFEALLDYLKRDRECDLKGYKRSTLMRRFHYRMQRINIGTYQGYLQYLQSHPQEHVALFSDVLINFTGFFRDFMTWAYLATEVIPQLIANKPSDEPIRIWSAGCATGQEVYSLLIVLAEMLGLENCLERVQVYATDADVDALKQAQQGVYRYTEIMGIPADLLEKYFEPTPEGYVFHPALRHSVTFQSHNLMQDAPLSAIDLLVCRNVLMYFTQEAQESILTRFHSALHDIGVLFIGQAELLLNQKQLFTPLNLKQRVYTKKSKPDGHPMTFKGVAHHVVQYVGQHIRQHSEQHDGQHIRQHSEQRATHRSPRHYCWETALRISA